MYDTMSAQRRRFYSFSSTESIIEKYSSSPRSSAGLPNYDFGSSESINWDEDPEEEEEQQPCRTHQREVRGQSTFPQTVGYWSDSWIGEIGTTAKTIDLKALCAGMQLWREKNEIPRVPMCQAQPLEQQSSMAYNVNALRSEDGLYVSQSNWDELLREMKSMARDMHQARKWREQGRKSVSRWCKWGANERLKERGDFVEEFAVGYEIERGADGEVWSVKLGYRRNDAVADEMDLDEDDGEGGINAEDRALVEEEADSEALQNSQSDTAQRCSSDTDLMMASKSSRA